MTGFTPAVRDAIRAGAQASAAVLVPRLIDLYHPASLLDVGCGEGWFASEFARLGVAALGIDHPDTWGADLMRAPIQLAPVDLAREGSIRPGTFDMTLCLEVAEHLPAERAWSFVAELCATAPTVVFSAAIPGQGGTHHVNEQWPGYWCDLFLAHGFRTDDKARWRIWDDARVEPWYRQNLVIYERREAMGVKPPAVVHPAFWDARR